MKNMLLALVVLFTIPVGTASKTQEDMDLERAIAESKKSHDLHKIATKYFDGKAEELSLKDLKKLKKNGYITKKEFKIIKNERGLERAMKESQKESHERHLMELANKYFDGKEHDLSDDDMIAIRRAGLI